jgi:hypothetical protein
MVPSYGSDRQRQLDKYDNSEDNDDSAYVSDTQTELLHESTDNRN